jgi:purine-binding chemotaxis protein CheW
MMHHLLFSVDRVRCAIPLAGTRLVIQMVQLGPAPEIRPGQAGSINLHGQVIPVFSVRSFFGMPGRDPQLTDMLIIAQAGADTVALWVDETHVIQQSPVSPAPAEIVEKGEEGVPGADVMKDGTCLITDLSRFLESGTSGMLRTLPAPGHTRGVDTP